MSTTPLSLPDGQNSLNYPPGPSSDAYNGSSSNFYPNQYSPLLPTTPVSGWGNTSQINQGQSYQIQGNNSSGYNQGISESSHVQQNKYLQEMVAKLQFENNSLKAERTTIQNAYSMLVSQLTHSNSYSSASMTDGPINVAMRPAPISTPLLLNGSSPPSLNRADHKSVQFWTEKEWKTWLNQTTEGQCANQYTSFIEDEQGKLLDTTDIGTILQTARDVWHEFRIHGIINSHTTWSSMPLSAKNTFRNEVVWSHPELNLCEGTWKSNMLGKKHYSGFKQTWFTNKLDSNTKRKVKKEVVDELDISSPELKHAKLGLSPSPDCNNSSSDVPQNSSSISASSSASSINPASTRSGSSAPQMLTPSPDRSFPDVGEFNTSNNSVVEGNTMDPPLIKHPLLSVRPAGPPTANTCPPQKASSTSDDIAHGPVNFQAEQASRGGLPVTNKAISPCPVQNDLISIPALQPSMDIVPGMVSWPPMQAVPTPTLQLPKQPAPVLLQKTTIGDKKKAWRPPSNKSARTLCMHRYQKQIGGSLEEFNAYFEELSAEAKAKYKDEVKQLVSSGVWSSGTTEIIAKFSNLPMY